MAGVIASRLARLHHALRQGLEGPQALAFTPALALGAFWMGGESLLVAVALVLPALFYAAGVARAHAGPAPEARARDVMTVTALTELADEACRSADAAHLGTACLLIEVDGLEAVARSAGARAVDTLRELVLTRLRNQLRAPDTAIRIGDNRFAVLLAPAMRLDLETLLQLATRLQSAIEEPASHDDSVCFFAASIGAAGSLRMRGPLTGARLVEGAQIALGEAVHRGPSSIRAWNETMARDHSTRRMLLAEVRKALSDGQIQPWFQPQLCTSTGALSGVEALARWIHPERGVVPPAEFLRCLEDARQMDSLGRVILQHSLTALRSWDAAGLEVPRVSVNFSDDELRVPNVADRVKWELDRYGVPPHRLGIEVLETVLGSESDGVIARNVRDLGKLGCFIDLDDFGTGHASLTALTTLRIDRLKIDRTYVSRVDRDENQRRMIAAVLSLAERLGLETLAEGVETVGEHALLAQLGCAHVQGFGIAHPMPGDKLVAWAAAHHARIAEAQRLARGSR